MALWSRIYYNAVYGGLGGLLGWMLFGVFVDRAPGGETAFLFLTRADLNLLLGGAIITETVFAWPGVATLTVDSIRNQDFPVVQCAVVLLALLIVAVNLLVDILVGFIDPRVRAGA